MQKGFRTILLLMVILSVFGCYGYRAYLGLHGKSIRLFPDEHEAVTEDRECLECHHPNNSEEGSPTPHPNFKGCIKCHNDEIETARG